MSLQLKNHYCQSHHINQYYKRIIQIFIVLLPFTCAFSIHPWTPLPLLFLLSSLPITMILVIHRPKFKIYKLIFNSADIFLLFFVLSVTASLIFVMLRANIQQENINHLFALYIVIFIYYYYLKFLFSLKLKNATIDLGLFMKLLTFVFFIIAIYALIEFFCINFRAINIDRFVYYYPDLNIGRGTYLGYLLRSRGFTSEPWKMGMLLNFLGPLSIGYLICIKKRILSICASIVYIIALIVTFSAGAIGNLFIGLIISLFIYLLDIRSDKFKIKKLIPVCFLSFVFILGIFLTPMSYKEGIIRKVTFSRESGVDDRIQRWQNAYSYIKENPWGIGFGSISASEGTGVVSFYLKIITEAGIVSFSIYLVFLYIYLKKIISFPKWHLMKYFYLISFISLCGHYAIVGGWWLPWFWFLLVLISYDLARTTSIHYMHIKR